MDNKEIVVALNRVLPKLEIFEESVDMGLAVLEFRYIKIGSIEITVNNRKKGEAWNRDKDEVLFVAFRKQSREKIRKFLEEVV